MVTQFCFAIKQIFHRLAKSSKSFHELKNSMHYDTRCSEAWGFMWLALSLLSVSAGGMQVRGACWEVCKVPTESQWCPSGQATDILNLNDLEGTTSSGVSFSLARVILACLRPKHASRGAQLPQGGMRKQCVSKEHFLALPRQE